MLVWNILLCSRLSETGLGAHHLVPTSMSSLTKVSVSAGRFSEEILFYIINFCPYHWAELDAEGGKTSCIESAAAAAEEHGAPGNVKGPGKLVRDPFGSVVWCSEEELREMGWHSGEDESEEEGEDEEYDMEGGGRESEEDADIEGAAEEEGQASAAAVNEVVFSVIAIVSVSSLMVLLCCTSLTVRMILLTANKTDRTRTRRCPEARWTD